MTTPNFLGIGFLIQLSCFIYPNHDWLSTYETVSKGVMIMWYNAHCNIADTGTNVVKMFDGATKILGDVRHVQIWREILSLWVFLIQKSISTLINVES